MKLKGRTGEAWDMCHVCGFIWPVSKLTLQRGQLRGIPCNCIDNLEIEQRELTKQRILQQSAKTEGADERQEQWGFFDHYDYVEG